jgi:hypothetical protein
MPMLVTLPADTLVDEVMPVLAAITYHDFDAEFGGASFGHVDHAAVRAMQSNTSGALSVRAFGV